MIAHLWGKTVGVVSADLEGDQADVAEDRIRGGIVELGEVLVCDDQGEAVLAVTGAWNAGTPGSVFNAAA